ncbi:hypothetical protein EYZ11_006211 [Aspergillus tanneri]|uniref:Auxiliary Activity family 9 catalytic domain-containing protein n=1 Tax=Aspergillus tanneri TaxID=1220188 RepID=A0A4S3JGK7_9EURO|nr:uncharacterized protein ATNIH1004_000754 [Aspergillus tanneri]KAA8651856.1 hypothetical protein ATNIH1004_000754 [Aspergillus tanneri]THC94305.1 hypothetical protein EYZ11_006211 [Aspergillus tanneri]
MSIAKLAGVFLGSAALVAGHGYVSGAVVDGKYYGGYIVTSYAYSDNPPDTIGWSTEAKDLGFVDGSSYSDPDIICHKSAKPGAISAEIPAGGKIELQWTEWPESHHGPVLTYLANCNGDCSSVDKSSLEFFKIDEKGLVDGSKAPGTWASDQLIKSNNSWTVTIPSNIASGNYVLRHEIIGLHSAGNKDGAQNYPQCFNLKVTGGGSDKPKGTLGTKLYNDTDPGILVSIYQNLDSYEIPGPALYSGSSSGPGPISASSIAVLSYTPAPSSTKAASSVQTSTTTGYQASTTVASATITGSPVQQSSTASAPPAPVLSSDSSSDSSSAPAPTGGSWTEYFNSLSPKQFLNLLSETVSWLVTKKKHARDFSA